MMKKHKNLAARRLKQILFISLTLFLINSISAQDVAVAQPSWYQQAQQQLYGFGQKGWEKTKEGIAWIRAHPKEAAALGLGGLGVALLVYEARKDRRTPTVLETRRKVPDLDEAGEIRKRLRKQILSFYPEMLQTEIQRKLRVFTEIYEGKSIQEIDLEKTGYDKKLHLRAELPSFRVPFSVGTLGTYDLHSPAETHSLISVALISRNTSLEEKRKLIKSLLDNGVQTTQEDCRLSQLELWERQNMVRQEAVSVLSDIVGSETPTYLQYLPREIHGEIGESVALKERPLIPREYCPISLGGEQKE